MRYRWDDDEHDGRVTVDGEEVARTGARFWGDAPRLAVGEQAWAYRVAAEGLVGALVQTDELGAEARRTDRLGVERGRIWQSSWAMAGLDGPLRLSRTTSWLAGRLHFDVHRGEARVAEVLPEGPWQYRPSLEATGPIAHAEAVFVLWAAYRIDARRPLRQVRPGGMSGGGGGATIG